MATKNSRLSEILKQEYKTSGVVGGLASAAGKRALEKLDIRNALFGGSGVGSLIGRKIFGKGYSAIAEKSSADKLSSQSTPILAAQSDKLDVIGMNTQITAKNSMALPSMARDMNVMRQNIIKMVKLQGGTPTNKADAFFSKAKDRESIYENLFKKDKQTTPTKTETPEKSKGFLGTLLSGFTSLATLIVGTIKSTLSGIPTILAEVFSIKNMMSAFGVVANTLSGIFKIVGLIATNPVFLAIAGITSAAAMLSFMRGNYDAEKERYMELAEKKKNQGSLSVEEEKELVRLDRPNFKSEATTKLNYDPIAGVASTAKTPGQIGAENRRNAPLQNGSTTGISPSKLNEKFDMDKYSEVTRKRESGGRYGIDNKQGFLGAYQFGSEALETFGLLNRGASKHFGKDGPNAAVYHPEAWVEGMSLQKFLSDKNLQDTIMMKYTNMNMQGLMKSGVLSEKSSVEDIVGALSVAHHGGVGAAKKLFLEGADTKDKFLNTSVAQTRASAVANYSGSGSAINQSSTQMAELSRESLVPQSPNVTVTAPATPQTQQQTPITVSTADVIDTDFGKLLARMY